MKRRHVPLWLTLVLTPCLVAQEPDPPAAAEDEQPILEHANEAWTGDLDGMKKRGFIRILTVHNPLLFAFDQMGQHGFSVDLGKAFEEHLNETIGRTTAPTVLFIPVARDELLPSLVAGRGDIAAANISITPGRQKDVAFSEPLYPNVKELVVTGPAAPGIATFDDLARSEVYVRRSSSYYEHLQELNGARQKAGKPPIPLRDGDENLEDHDLLDMVHNGILPAVVVDSHKLGLWKQVFSKIVVHEDLVVHAGSSIAWALRKDSPKLLGSVNAFTKKVRKGTMLGNILLKRYLTDAEWMNDALAQEDRARYEATIEIIRAYADRYDFDALMIAAQAYQESRFDQSKRSSAGAIGVMQLLPTTAADPAVGIPDVSTIEANVHAGVKYMRWLRAEFFSDPEIAPLDRILFAFAAYNAGPGNVARARRTASRLGFDPDRWFGHVEIGMYRSVSGEPVSYVRNIYKYYVTYARLEEARKEREEALRAVGER